MSSQMDWEYATMNGAGFMSGSGQLSVALNGNLRFLISNPANSGKTCYIAELQLFATVLGYATLLANPTNTPANTALAVNTSFAGTAPVCTVKYDSSTTALAGTGTGVALVGQAASPQIFNAPFPLFIIPPGQALGLNLPFTAAAIGLSNIRWVER